MFDSSKFHFVKLLFQLFNIVALVYSLFSGPLIVLNLTLLALKIFISRNYIEKAATKTSN